MKPAWSLLAAMLLLVSGCQGGQIPGSAHQPQTGHGILDSGPSVPGSMANSESMQRMLKEMRLLTEQGSLAPEQQAEINALMKQLQSLKQRANHASTDRSRHHKKIQEIQQRLDDIKRQIQQKPNIRHKLPIYICMSGSVQPGPPALL